MRSLNISCIAGFVLAASGAAAHAQGLYAGGLLGIGDGEGEIANSGLDLEFDAGPFVNAFVGKDLGSVRLEGELAYRQNDMDNILGIPVAGEMTSVALMANIYYDFGAGTGITPYIGAGLGAAYVTFDSVDLLVDDNDTTFALQLMVGVSFPISPSVSIITDLRSFGAIPEFTDDFGFPFEQEYFIYSLSLGLSVSF